MQEIGDNEDAILLDSGAAPVRDDPGGEHHLWLAMQAAHKVYKQASATLDALTAMTPRTHSESTGKTVPQKVAKAKPTSTQLLSKKAASRDSMESSSFSLLSSGRR